MQPQQIHTGQLRRIGLGGRDRNLRSCPCVKYIIRLSVSYTHLEYKKPDATTEITRENFRTLLWPLPIRELFTVGPATAKKCIQRGMRTIGALAEAQPAFLESFLGRSGRMLWAYANGLDESPVSRFTDEEDIKSIGNGTTFRKDLYTSDEILTAVTALSLIHI